MKERNSVSNEQPPHQCAMQTDIPEIMQPEILGMKLTTVPITFMETEEEGNTTDPFDETLTKSTYSSGAIMLYCYILAPQTLKACCSSGAKSKNFSSIATVHIYL